MDIDKRIKEFIADGWKIKAQLPDFMFMTRDDKRMNIIKNAKTNTWEIEVY